MRDAFSHVLRNYQEESRREFAQNELARFIRHDLRDRVREQASLPDLQYGIKASPGEGRWAQVPWCGIFDKTITQSAREGYYIVYLFRPDMEGVYLSLNQGVTKFAERTGTEPEAKIRRRNIRRVADYWQHELRSEFDQFDFGAMNLVASSDADTASATTSLGSDYEAGHICGKYYAADDLPESSVMVRDLHELLFVHDKLRDRISLQFGNGNFSAANKHILGLPLATDETGAAVDKEDLQTGDDRDLKVLLEEQVNGEVRVILERSEPPTKLRTGPATRTFTPRKIDNEARQRAQTNLGLAGEKSVMFHERQRLRDMGREDLAEKVLHVSQDEGDGAGYDIRSFEADGTPRFIEVKTTEGDIGTSYFLSENEVDFSEKYPDQFVLYRIYDFDARQMTGWMYQIAGNLRTALQLEPVMYKATGGPEDRRG